MNCFFFLVSPKSKTNGNRSNADADIDVEQEECVLIHGKMNGFPQPSSSSAVVWDMDFNGQWEMDRDLIGEFIQTQKTDKGFKGFTKDTSLLNIKRNSMNKAYAATAAATGGGDDGVVVVNNGNINNHPITSYNDRCLDDEEDNILIKCLPMKLIDESLADDNYDVVKPFNIKEAQSISSLKSKFDENVKALWGDGGGTQHQETSSLASSFAGDTNSLSLFNFNSEYEQQKLSKVIVLSHHQQQQQQQQQHTDFHTKSTVVDMNNNIQHHHKSALTPSNIESKFIKSGTNLLMSIWSENAQATEPESLLCKEVSVSYKYLIALRAHKKYTPPSSSCGYK